METIFQPTFTERISKTETPSLVAKFLDWGNNQERNRFGWLGIILMAHGCVLTPLTLFSVILSGTNFVLFMSAFIAMGMAVVTNLAALPTKVTIPVFFLSILIDITIIVLCILEGFNWAATQI